MTSLYLMQLTGRLVANLRQPLNDDGIREDAAGTQLVFVRKAQVWLQGLEGHSTVDVEDEVVDCLWDEDAPAFAHLK